MKIDVSNVFFQDLFQTLNRQSALPSKIVSGVSVNRTRQNKHQLNTAQITGNYSGILNNKNTYISNTILNAINFDSSGVEKSGEVFRVNGTEFEANSYYKYTDEKGNEHKFLCKNKNLTVLYSDALKGNGVDKCSSKYAEFWNSAGSADPTFVGLNFSKGEVSSYFKEAGIEPGFYTVKIGGKEATNYYSEGKYSPGIIPKQVYDDTYYAMTDQSGFFHDYKPGSVFKIGDESYTLKEIILWNFPMVLILIILHILHLKCRKRYIRSSGHFLHTIRYY